MIRNRALVSVSVVSVSVSLGAVGCGPRVRDVAFEPGVSPGTGAVTFATSRPGDAFVRLTGADGSVDTPAVPAADGRIPVLGLRTGEAYTLEVVVAADGAESVSDPLDVRVAPPDREVIPLVLQSFDPALACDPGGHVLFSYIGAESSGVGIVDRDGNYVFSVARPASEQVGRVRPGRDGKSLLFNTADAVKKDDVAHILRVALDGSPLSDTRTLWGHHDFVELPEGRFAWLGYDIRPYAVPDDAYDLGEVPIAGEALYEGPEGMTDADAPDLVWDVWDDYPGGVYTVPEDAVRRNADWDPASCGDPSLAPPWAPTFLPCAYEFAHANSLAYVPASDTLRANWRWLDTMIEVERGTGALAWQWGGPLSDLAPADASTEPFEHAHFSDVWDDHMLVFDNRNPTELSRLVEYTVDGATFTQIWQYESDAYENLLGDVRRIPIDGCDNLLVSWSGQGRMSEITRDGTIVWDVVSPVIGNVTSRAFFLPDLYDLSGVDGAQ